MQVNLRTIRKQKNLTQFKLSLICGIPQAHISLYETSLRIPGLINASRIADALGKSIEEIWPLESILNVNELSETELR